MDIIECAIKKEQEAKQWYEQLAGQVTTPELKELYTILAASEDEHFRALEGLRKEEGGEVDFVALEGAACAFKPLMARLDAATALKGDADGFRRILTEEDENVKFYEELAAHAGDKRTKKLLARLTAEEKRHRSIVENIFTFVESPRTYLAWGEFSNLAEY